VRVEVHFELRVVLTRHNHLQPAGQTCGRVAGCCDSRGDESFR
jgi:hypothetical protein